jgi:hypothetical protein
MMFKLSKLWQNGLLAVEKTPLKVILAVASSALS